MSEIKTIQDFLALENPKGYDFREQIVEFQTEDVFARHIVYKAIGIAEEDLSDERTGKVPNDKWVAYREARAIYQAHKILTPGGEADTCDLVLAILSKLGQGQDVVNADTMNSIQTTINKALKLRSKRAMVAQYGQAPETLAEKMKEYGPDTRRYFAAAYTIGNFIPCPVGCNRPGTSLTKDYWDLTLWYIYCFYHCAPWRREVYLEKIFWGDQYAEIHMETYGQWLESFDTWDDFVEKNFLQDYTEWPQRPYGRPKEFWSGHFEDSSIPQTEEQMRAFFAHAAQCIMARSKRMMAGPAFRREGNLDLTRRQIGGPNTEAFGAQKEG